MSVLSRSALESSPLADLHEIASELGLESFRPASQGGPHRRDSRHDRR
ncbi:hypothetical protein LRS13_14965 [Svornostia abyssi]|uniref:Uncharacterized protein n=1 Tax=Svornostia abyssi TaxID=2898438 RepID=A0ABY5PBR6_9ACTN|nr:hypothetical protein LRS13_14965 [Parviterribacteraceae bacterium J379]